MLQGLVNRMYEALWSLGPDRRISADADPRAFALWEARGGFFSPDGGVVAMASLDRGTGVWIAATGAPLGAIPALNAAIGGGGVSDDGKTLAIVGLHDGQWRALDRDGW